MRFLYLHGLASGPRSTKGMRFAEHFAARGVELDRLNLRVPSFEHMRLSQMIDVAQRAIGDQHERAVAIGSSLGGLTAARLAERDARIDGLVLFAPAFQIVERWRVALGDGFTDWERTGFREVLDYTTGQLSNVDFGFVEDARTVDVGFPDVRVPTLIIHGIHDEVVPIDHSRRFAAGKPHVRLVEVDDGHELVASLPRLLAEADAFLGPWLGCRPWGWDRLATMRLDHIAIWVEDPLASVAFYVDVVGLEAVRVDEFTAKKCLFPSVRISGDSLIDLVPMAAVPMIESIPGAKGTAGHKVNHVCLAMTKAELEALAARLEARGTAPGRHMENQFGARGLAPKAFYFKDLDGNVIEARYYE